MQQTLLLLLLLLLLALPLLIIAPVKIVLAQEENKEAAVCDGEKDVLVIGGSFAGISGALSMARASLSVILVDTGSFANRNSQHAHNIFAHDGHVPRDLKKGAKEQLLLNYDSVTCFEGSTVTSVEKKENFFEARITLNTGEPKMYRVKRILLATGILDILPPIPGANECWARSLIHCPFCHGYEFKNRFTAFIGNPKTPFDETMMYMVLRMIKAHWTREVALFTNGPSKFSPEITKSISKLRIPIVETTINEIVHHDGMMSGLELSNGTLIKVTVGYTKPGIQFHGDLVQKLGLELAPPFGLVKIDQFGKTNVDGVFAAGDLTNPFRSVPSAIASGNIAGAGITKDLADSILADEYLI